jgi:hypothetical protein
MRMDLRAAVLDKADIGQWLSGAVGGASKPGSHWRVSRRSNKAGTRRWRCGGTRPSRGETLRALPRLAGHHISPQCLDIRGTEQVAPWRHLVLAMRHGGNEALVLIGRKFAQIEGTFRILHTAAVAGRAVSRVNRGARPDALRRKFLRGCGRGEQKKCAAGESGTPKPRCEMPARHGIPVIPAACQ